MFSSALAVPSQPYYESVTDKAGALLRSMVKNHPFVDGNKRLGLATTFVFLVFNGRLLLCTNEAMVNFALALAASEPAMTWEEVAAWVSENSSEFAQVVERHPEFGEDMIRQLSLAIDEIEELTKANP